MEMTADRGRTVSADRDQRVDAVLGELTKQFLSSVDLFP
ncbi:MAG: hypothetical protein ACJAR2_000154 [Ilumatobacter sp.]|jgi:hypothetical protein